MRAVGWMALGCAVGMASTLALLALCVVADQRTTAAQQRRRHTGEWDVEELS